MTEIEILGIMPIFTSVVQHIRIFADSFPPERLPYEMPAIRVGQTPEKTCRISKVQYCCVLSAHEFPISSNPEFALKVAVFQPLIMNHT